MENPGTWTKAEHVVHAALLQADKDRENGVYGLSRVRQITDALRRDGLLKEEDSE